MKNNKDDIRNILEEVKVGNESIDESVLYDIEQELANTKKKYNITDADSDKIREILKVELLKETDPMKKVIIAAKIISAGLS